MSLNGMRMGGEFKSPLSKKDKLVVTGYLVGWLTLLGGMVWLIFW